MVGLRSSTWVLIVAAVGLACAGTAIAMESDADAGGDDSPGANFRICAPPTDVGPIAACQIVIG